MVNSLHPQEIELYYIIPALRREIAACMKTNGFAQKQIAKLLGVTEPAVSQYFSAKRANAVTFSDRILQQIKSSTLKIKDHNSMVAETQKLLHLARREGLVCDVHKQLGFEDCDVKFCLCRPGVKR